MKRLVTDEMLAYIRAQWPTKDAEVIAEHLGVKPGFVRRCASKNRLRKHPDVIRELAVKASRASREKRAPVWPTNPAMDLLTETFGMRALDLETGSKQIHRTVDD